MNLPCSTIAVGCAAGFSGACGDACTNGSARKNTNAAALNPRIILPILKHLICCLQNKHGEYPYCEPSSKVRNPAKSLFSRLILWQRRSNMAASKKGSHEQKCVVAGYD